jgi:hypothetical protein
LKLNENLRLKRPLGDSGRSSKRGVLALILLDVEERVPIARRVNI